MAVTVLWQLGLLIASAIGFMLIDGWLGFRSVLLGGSAWLVPGLYFLWRMQKLRPVVNPTTMLRGFLVSEMVKLTVSFGMIAGILWLWGVNRWGFLSGYALMIVTSSVSSLVKYGTKK